MSPSVPLTGAREARSCPGPGPARTSGMRAPGPGQDAPPSRPETRLPAFPAETRLTEFPAETQLSAFPPGPVPVHSRGPTGLTAAGRPASQSRVDRLRLQGEDREDGLVDPPQRLAAAEPVEGLQAERVLAQGERALVAEEAAAQPV